MNEITIHTFLLTHCVIGINGAFIGSWLGLNSTSKLKQAHLIGRTSSSRFHRTRESNSTKSPELPIVLKHELEDEYHPEETTPNPGQEIDETNPHINCKSTPSSADDLKITNTSSKKAAKDKEKEFGKNIIKHEPIIITSTIIKVATKYAKVFPSCLKFEHVSRVCDGILITMEPIPNSNNNFLQRSSNTYEVTEDANEYSLGSSTVVSPSLTRYGEFATQPSDYDYEFESLQLSNDGGRIKIHEATPELRRDNSMEENQSTRKLNFWHEQKYVIQSEVISITKTVTTTDAAQTATVVASDCVPRHIQIPLCSVETDHFFEIPQFPIETYP